MCSDRFYALAWIIATAGPWQMRINKPKQLQECTYYTWLFLTAKLLHWQFKRQLSASMPTPAASITFSFSKKCSKSAKPPHDSHISSSLVYRFCASGVPGPVPDFNKSHTHLCLYSTQDLSVCQLKILVCHPGVGILTFWGSSLKCLTDKLPALTANTGDATQ